MFAELGTLTTCRGVDIFETGSGTRQFDTFSVVMFRYTFSGPTFDTFSVDLTHLAELTHLA